MDVKQAIQTRRAYRSLAPVQITEELVKDLAEAAQLTPSCFNNQPWRYVFVYDTESLKQLFTAMSKGNEWTYSASMVIAVSTKKELDCIIKTREYALFDTGMATANMILRATELGLVAHPIAGFNEAKVKEILGIPGEMTVITLVNVGKHSDTINPVLNEKQAEAEKTRPERLSAVKFAFINKYMG